MSGPALFTNVFRSTPAHASRTPLNQAKRRDRQQLSCNQCRTRKLKCERGRPPCTTCVRRGLVASCTFPTNKSTTAARKPPLGRVNRSADQLRRLENIIVQMSDPAIASRSVCALLRYMGCGLKHDFETDSQSFIAPERSTTAQISENGIFKGYVGSTHWSAVMENVRPHLAAAFWADSMG